MSMKGVSALIATILLIAFAVGAGGIVSLWLTGFTSTQTSTVGATGEKVIKCANSVLDIDAVYNKSFSIARGMIYGDFNLTVIYYTGTEDLYNFTISLTDNGGTVGSQSNTSKYVKNSSGTWPMKPGEKFTFVLQLGSNLTQSPVIKARVSALCQDSYTISREESV